MFLLLENMLLFHPTPAAAHWMPPPSERIQDVEFQADDGNRIHAWWYPVEEGRGALLYCHGNAGNLSHRGPAIVQMGQELGVSVLIFDYPGFGRSTGSPNEASCYAAGEAAFNWLTRTPSIPPEQILLYGKSLGGGIAVELATRHPHRALILAKTFTSVPDIGQEVYPFLPIRWLARNRFENLNKIPHCTRPVFIAHGDRDELIGKHHSERLFAAANEPKHFVLMNGVDHNEPVNGVFFTELRQFLAAAAPLPLTDTAPTAAAD